VQTSFFLILAKTATKSTKIEAAILVAFLLSGSIPNGWPLKENITNHAMVAK